MDDSRSSPRPANFAPLQLVLLPAGMSINLVRQDQVLGRHSSADVRLPLPDVSRRHCRLLFTDGEWHIIDLGSLNGLYINEKKVHQSVIRPGDKLRIGGFVFEVRKMQGDPTINEPLRDLRRAG